MSKPTISKGVFVWRDAKLFSTMEDQLLLKRDEFVDGKKEKNALRLHRIGFNDTQCHRCEVGSYTTITQSSLIPERLRHHRRSSEADLRGAHGNVLIREEWGKLCTFCGFTYYIERSSSGHMHQTDWFDLSLVTLKRFALNDAHLAIGEIACHVKQNPAEVLHLDPFKYEELVASVFKQFGYNVIRTQKTRDGGYDLMLYSNGSEEPVLVECKRYSRTVGVKVVRELTGVMFRLGLNRGAIVAPVAFSKDAQREVRETISRQAQYEMHLVQLQSLLNELNVYNKDIPDLDALAQMGDNGAKMLLEEYNQGWC